jgi:flagellar motor switch protein FliG
MKLNTRLLITAALLAFGFGNLARAALPVVEIAKKTGEAQIRHLIEPVLQKYCQDDCKLLAVNVDVDVATPDEVNPGFDQVNPKADVDLEPSSAQLKLIIDSKIGPQSRQHLMDLLQQHLDTLSYPATIDAQIVHFPQPLGSAAKITELRDKVTKQFRSTIEDLFRQFCPRQCLLADLDLKTDIVNGEEAEYGSSNEFVQDDGFALRIKQISATILMDDSLTPEEQKNVLEMATLKTNQFHNVELTGKAMHFPTATLEAQRMGLEPVLGLDAQGRELASKRNTDTTNTTTSEANHKTENQNDLKSNTTNQNNTESKSDQKSTSASNNNSTTTESNMKQEHFERFEKIERVENGDVVQKELDKFKVYGVIFAASILSLLIFIAMATFRSRFGNGASAINRVIHSVVSDPHGASAPTPGGPGAGGETASFGENAQLMSKRLEIERLRDELMNVFATQPKVAKQVFSRILTEEGVEVTGQYIHLFGESIVIDLLRDPSLQSDMQELMEFYAKSPMELTDDEKLELLQKLHNRTVAGKLVVLGNRSSNSFDFLGEMDGLQILELIRNESMTVKAIILTQCDAQKRQALYSQLDESTRMKLLNELSRIDYLPRDYIFNVANALKRKRRENPRLNTEALPGSEVLVTLLERTQPEMQKHVLRNLDTTNPESARNVKSKLVSIDTLKYLRDGQLLEVVLSLKHDELLQFLKGAPEDIRQTVFQKSPRELVAELEEELLSVTFMSREGYAAVERKIHNRMKLMANEGLINLVEVNERMFSMGEHGFEPEPGTTELPSQMAIIKKVSGW